MAKTEHQYEVEESLMEIRLAHSRAANALERIADALESMNEAARGWGGRA